MSVWVCECGPRPSEENKMSWWPPVCTCHPDTDTHMYALPSLVYAGTRVCRAHMCSSVHMLTPRTAHTCIRAPGDHRAGTWTALMHTHRAQERDKGSRWASSHLRNCARAPRCRCAHGVRPVKHSPSIRKPPAAGIKSSLGCSAQSREGASTWSRPTVWVGVEGPC